MRGARRGGPDRWLHLKLALFFLGAGFFVAGVLSGRDWAVAVAIAVLAVAMVVRLLPRRGGGEEEG